MSGTGLLRLEDFGGGERDGDAIKWYVNLMLEVAQERCTCTHGMLPRSRPFATTRLRT